MYEYAMLLDYEDGERETYFANARSWQGAVGLAKGHADLERHKLASEPMFLAMRETTGLAGELVAA